MLRLALMAILGLVLATPTLAGENAVVPGVAAKAPASSREREARGAGGERDPERPRHAREAPRRGEPSPRARALLLGDAPAALAEEDEERLVGDEREDDRRRERRGREPRPPDRERREERHRELPPRAMLVREHRSRWSDGTGGRALGGRGRGHGAFYSKLLANLESPVPREAFPANAGLSPADRCAPHRSLGVTRSVAR